MHTDDVPKTTVITQSGLLECLRMSLGLKGVTQTFNILMEFCATVRLSVCLHNILVASPLTDEHLVHLKQVF